MHQLAAHVDTYFCQMGRRWQRYNSVYAGVQNIHTALIWSFYAIVEGRVGRMFDDGFEFLC